MVKIAAHHLNKRGGVLIGDVVGLGKTLMATALARIFEDDHGVETLIICPKNLVPMWEDYRQQYRLRAKVLSATNRSVPRVCLTPRRYRLVLIDEAPQPSQPRRKSATVRSPSTSTPMTVEVILLSADAVQYNLPRPLPINLRLFIRRQ